MILTFFLISRKFLIEWYITCIDLHPKKIFFSPRAWQNGKSAIMENWPRPKIWTIIFFHHHITPEQDQKPNRVRKALHTQSHSDPGVVVKLQINSLEDTKGKGQIWRFLDQSLTKIGQNRSKPQKKWIFVKILHFLTFWLKISLERFAWPWSTIQFLRVRPKMTISNSN